jgi:HEAT repeat protein
MTDTFSTKQIGRNSMQAKTVSRIKTTTFSFVLAGCFAAGVVPARADVDKAWSLLQTGAADKNKEHREHAIKALGLLSNNVRALDLATGALSDPTPEVRAAAAESLGRMHGKAAAPRLKEILKTEKDVGVIIAGARALVTLGDDDGYDIYYAVLTGEKKSKGGMLDDQKKMLHDPKKMAQFGFEEGIGFVPFAGIGVEAFKALRKDDSSPVRAAAARVLADDPDPDTTDALLAAAADKSWIVRAAALDALSHRNDAGLAEKIAKHLDDPKEEVRFTAAAAIIHLTDGKRKRS